MQYQNAASVAAAASAAANAGGTAKAAFMMKELAKLTTELSHQMLQARAAQAVLDALRLCEQHAQHCIMILIKALQEPQDGPELAADAGLHR